MGFKFKPEERQILDESGGLSEIREGLTQFRNSVSVLMSKIEELTSKYSKVDETGKVHQWIAVRRGEDVVATAPDIEDLLKRIDEAGVPRGEVLVQLVAKERWATIL